MFSTIYVLTAIIFTQTETVSKPIKEYFSYEECLQGIRESNKKIMKENKEQGRYYECNSIEVFENNITE